MNPKIIYFPNGNKQYEMYYNDLNQFHNENGPAYIFYYQNGNKESETYYINGNFHNTKGPTYIEYDENGKIILKEYCLNGKFIDVNSDEEFQKYAKRLNIS